MPTNLYLSIHKKKKKIKYYLSEIHISMKN